MKVVFSGGELTDKEKKIITDVLNSNKKASPHIYQVRFSVKEYSKTGLQHKVVIDLEADTDFGRVHADADSWRFSLAVRNASNKLFKQVIHSTRARKESMQKRFMRKIRHPFTK